LVLWYICKHFALALELAMDQTFFAENYKIIFSLIYPCNRQKNTLSMFRICAGVNFWLINCLISFLASIDNALFHLRVDDRRWFPRWPLRGLLHWT
jgi:hypothetical protein